MIKVCEDEDCKRLEEDLTQGKCTKCGGKLIKLPLMKSLKEHRIKKAIKVFTEEFVKLAGEVKIDVINRLLSHLKPEERAHLIFAALRTHLVVDVKPEMREDHAIRICKTALEEAAQIAAGVNVMETTSIVDLDGKPLH